MPKSRTKRKNIVKKVYYPKRNYPTAIKILHLLARKRILSTKEIADELGSKYSYSHKRVRLVMIDLAELDYCEHYRWVTNKNHICPFCKIPTKLLVKSDELEKAVERIENDRKAIEKYQKEESYDPNIYCVCESGFILGQLIHIKCNGCEKNIPIAPHFNDKYKIQQDKYWVLSYNGILVLLVLLKSKAQSNFIAKNINHKIIELVYALLNSQKKQFVDMLYYILKETNMINPNLQKVADDWYKEIRTRILDLKLDEKLDHVLFEYREKHRLGIRYENTPPRSSTLG